MSFYDQVHDTVAALVMFYTPEEEASRKMLSVINEVKSRVTGSAQVIEVNVEYSPQTIEREKIKALPAFAVYRYGRCVWRGTGQIAADDLLKRLEASAIPDPANEIGHHHHVAV